LCSDQWRINDGPARRRALVDDLRSIWNVSIRRARGVLQAPRSSHHDRPRGDERADLKSRIREIAETRVRYGHRRVHVLPRREGRNVNAKRIYRLYKEMGLQLRNKTPKRRVKARLREDRIEATMTNETRAFGECAHSPVA